MFFVVSTGRSGTQTLARVLDQHPLCRCLHEPHPLLIKLAAERCHQAISDHELAAYLIRPRVIFPHRVGLRLYGESDHRLSFLIPVLAQLGDATRFVWLIRDGRKVVASTYLRGWYGQEELTKPYLYTAKYRFRGDLSGDVGPAVWERMTRFEKCCWYWSYTNETIQRELARLDPARWILLPLEQLAGCLPDLLAFLDLPYHPLRMLHANKSPRPPEPSARWNEHERSAFESWCGSLMDRYYPGWREVAAEAWATAFECDHPRSKDSARAIIAHAQWFLKKIGGRITAYR